MVERSDNPLPVPLPEAISIGRSAYELSFNVCFVDEEAIDPVLHSGFLMRVIPRHYAYGFPRHLAGKSVAVVGNGVVRGHGAAIDAHDEVIRISAMRNWMVSATDDGLRTTLWAGQLAFVISNCSATPAFAALAQAGVPLWGLSPFHITCDALRWLGNQTRTPDLIILPAPALLFDAYHRFLSAADIELIFSIPPARRQLTGLSRYECLLTGTRLLLALEACGVQQIDLYGFDLFAGREDTVWFGHDLDVDQAVMQSVQTRLFKKGGYLKWHET